MAASIHPFQPECKDMSTYQTTFSTKRLWLILTTGMIVMFGVLLFLGGEIYQQAPPMPKTVKSESGEILYTLDDIQTGQNVWQSIGGMQQGSIWGHGSYLAPGCTAKPKSFWRRRGRGRAITA